MYRCLSRYRYSCRLCCNVKPYVRLARRSCPARRGTVCVGCRFGFGEAWAAQERLYVNKSHDTSKHNINKQSSKHGRRAAARLTRHGAARRVADGRGWRVRWRGESQPRRETEVLRRRSGGPACGEGRGKIISRRKTTDESERNSHKTQNEPLRQNLNCKHIKIQRKESKIDQTPKSA